MGSKTDQTFWFSVGTPQVHATVWRLWANKKGDVYIGPRLQAGDAKLSIHPSGVRHLKGGGPDDYGESVEGEPLAPGTTHRWKMPKPGPRDHEMVWRIVTPPDQLREARLDPRFKKGVLWIKPAPAGQANGIAIAIFPDLLDGVLPGADAPTDCLVRWRLGNGNTLLLLHSQLPFNIEPYRPEIAKFKAPDSWREEDARVLKDYRAHLHLDGGGFRGLIDFAYDPPPG